VNRLCIDQPGADGVAGTAHGGPTAVTIGTFDGVHAGHRSLIERARTLVDRGDGRRPVPGRVIALVFDPGPSEVLRPKPPGTPTTRLSTFEQRRSWLMAAGTDAVERLEPTAELLALEPEHFLRSLVALHHPAFIVEGEDFRFGHNRHGDIDTLRRLGRAMGFQAEIVPELSVPLIDQTLAPARSTTVRALLAAGRVRDAAAVLTRPYTLTGRVVPGDRRGRNFGIPTANVDSPCLPPRDGVYSGLATLPNGASVPAAISVGAKPHFATGNTRAVEAHLMPDAWGSLPAGNGHREWSPLPGLPEYGWTIELAFIGWVRDQMRFPTIDDLLAQIRRDCKRVLDGVAERPFPLTPAGVAP
jgi:riboflavin kinase/FMN adenylyltransferase